MQNIRYTQRICNDRVKIETFLARARVGVLGMYAEGYPYAVPVNFLWHDGCVYFHGMGSGKKEELLSISQSVCFTVYEEFGTVTDPVPCHADTSYMSVMLFGKAQKVTDCEAAAAALQKLVEKFMRGYYKRTLSGTLAEKYRSSMDGNAVSVYRIVPDELTAKENAAAPDKLFHEKTL